MVEEITGIKILLAILGFIEVFIFVLLLGMGSNLDKLNRKLGEVRRFLNLDDTD